MPSPTEQVPLPLPIKDSMEQSQEIVSHVNPENPEDEEDSQVHEEQGITSSNTVVKSSSPSHMTDSPKDETTSTVDTTAASPTTTTITTTIVPPPPPPPTTTTTSTTTATATTTTTQDTTHDVKQEGDTMQQKQDDNHLIQDSSNNDINKSPKRKQKKGNTSDQQNSRRRTRNTSKSSSISAISDDQQQQQQSSSSSTKRISTSSTSRRNNIDLSTSPIEFPTSNGRQLPSRDGINPSNISDRFVDFIMYCNPLAPESLDKVALVRSFNAVPKSDGKVFQTWSLYQLVGKHYAGEIRTWTKLAQKLGVVRTPEASPQKIQQYAVRLKKWMASVHVDAYFDYLLSRPNEYYELPQKNPMEGSDDESDVVLKLIKRAGSKRQKRKYTRKNTNASNTSNDDGAIQNSEGISTNMELDDETHFDSEDEGVDKHRGKRVRATYSDENEASEEDDKDPWNMEIDDYEDEESTERPTESTGSNQRRKSVVQVGFNSNYNLEKQENDIRGRLGEANPVYDSSRYYRQYPSQFAIEPKNGSDIPTPNPSPTTLPIMNLSSGNNTGSKRVLSHSGATGGAGTQKLRWRISTGPAHAVKSSADESYLTTSPSSYQKDSSKKKHDQSQVRDSKQSPMVRPSSRNIPNDQQQQQNTDGPNFAEMFLPRTLPSNDKESIEILQNNLIRAIGILEDNQRKIKMLDDLVHQRDKDVRQRVVRALKTEVNSVIDRFH